jgi:hypothetical protein
MPAAQFAGSPTGAGPRWVTLVRGVREPEGDERLLESVQVHMTIREVILGDDGIEYVRARLSTGRPLAQVLHRVDLTVDRALTFLPGQHSVPPSKLQEGGDLSSSDADLILQEAVSRVMGHFAAAKGRGWALSEDRYRIGLGGTRAARTHHLGHESTCKLDDREIYYLVDLLESRDAEDFLDAAADRANVSALGVGGIDERDLSVADWEVEVIPNVADHVRVIICEAFDEVGFAFWERGGVSRPTRLGR